MNNRRYVLIVYPILPQFKQLKADRAPTSVGVSVRTDKGAFLKNIVKIGDRLPCRAYHDITVSKFDSGDEESGSEEIHIRLFSNVSPEKTVELDDDLNDDPDPGLSVFADLFVKLPEGLMEEMTVRILFRFDEKGFQVCARWEELGEPLEIRLEQK